MYNFDEEYYGFDIDNVADDTYNTIENNVQINYNLILKIVSIVIACLLGYHFIGSGLNSINNAKSKIDTRPRTTIQAPPIKHPQNDMNNTNNTGRVISIDNVEDKLKDKYDYECNKYSSELMNDTGLSKF